MNDVERTAFIAAIREQPEEDTTRVVYADLLTEQGEEERAELIRVSVEKRNLGNRLPKDMFIEDIDRLNLLRERERELIAKLSPKCPVCRGSSYIVLRPYVPYLYLHYLTDLTSPRRPCTHCSGKGYIGTWDRGFLTSVTVPTIASVMKDEQVSGGLPDSTWEWQPTPYFRNELARHPLLTRITAADREPWELDTTNVAWWDMDGSRAENRATLPNPVYKRLRGVAPAFGGTTYASPGAAIDAAALAQCEVCRLPTVGS